MQAVLDIAIMAEINENDLEYAILHEVLQQRLPPFIRSTKYGRLNLDALTEREVILNFRFKREHLVRLADALRLPNIIRIPNRYSVNSELNKYFLFCIVFNCSISFQRSKVYAFT